MNNARFQDNNLRPTYMSQLEANELMELWAERQRDEAARQSLITVHDVAEATQLSVQDVERLLQEIRSKQPATNRSTVGPFSVAPSEQVDQPTLWRAYMRIAPITGIVAFLWAMMLRPSAYFYSSYWHSFWWMPEPRTFLVLYAIFVAFIFGQKFVRRLTVEKKSARSFLKDLGIGSSI